MSLNQNSGLTSTEAQEKLREFGPNAIIEPKRHPFINLLKKFWGPMPWLLEFIFIMQLLLHETDSTIITLFLLIFNAFVGFFQENKAQNALQLLRKKLQIKSRVLRDRKWTEIDAQEIVPGDLIHVRMGDFVPADIEIIEGSILADYSAITGESIPVELSAPKLALSGAKVQRGEATATVQATGKRSFFGKTAELVRLAQGESHVEKIVLSIVKWLVILDSLLVALIFFYSVIVEIPLREILPFALILLIASVPVALPATFTLMSALAALKLSDKEVLVTKLAAIAESASMNLLLTDKTGTLTKNSLILAKTFSAPPFTEKDLLRAAAITSSHRSQDPFDSAIFEKIGPRKFIEFESLINFIPFDPKIKRTEAIVKENGKTVRIIKGAPKVVAELSEDGEKFMGEAEALASEGYRVLSLAQGEERKSLKFLGFLAFLDPPREESKHVVEELYKLGVKVKMVTGDSTKTAQSIAAQIGIGSRACTKDDIKKNVLQELDIFAEVYPEDKLLLVDAFEKQGFIVGMTGDGVNDAPALKRASCGIAVSNATDVAKAAASLILTKPGLTSLLDALKTGREVYRRMLTYTLNKIIKTLHVALFLSLSLLLENTFVISPKLIMLLIFANDFITMSLASDNVKSPIFPCRLNIHFLVASASLFASVWVVFSFAVFFVGRDLLKLSLPELQTLIFLLFVFSGMATVFLIRNARYFWQLKPGKLLMISILGNIVIVSLLSYFGILMAPLSLGIIISLLAAVFVLMLLFDFAKVFTLTLMGRRSFLS